MVDTLHITSGDIAGSLLKESGVAGDVFVWHDILYDGPRRPGWPDDKTLAARASFLEQVTGGGLSVSYVLETLRRQYQTLNQAINARPILLWFDACLFDQSMLAHILALLFQRNAADVELLCLDAYPGVEPFHGLGQLQPFQLAAEYSRRRPVSQAQFRFAETVDQAFAEQDAALFSDLSGAVEAPLKWIPAAVDRWLQEQPDPITGLGRLESMALTAISKGAATPAEIFAAVAADETPPQFWGDTTLWAKINDLGERHPPLVRIEGPTNRLPQWEGGEELKRFRVFPIRSAARTHPRA